MLNQIIREENKNKSSCLCCKLRDNLYECKIRRKERRRDEVSLPEILGFEVEKWEMGGSVPPLSHTHTLLTVKRLRTPY